MMRIIIVFPRTEIQTPLISLPPLSSYLLIISVMANILYQMIKTHLPNISLSQIENISVGIPV